MDYLNDTTHKEEIKARLIDYIKLTGRAIDKHGHFKCFNSQDHKNGDANPSAYIAKGTNNQGWCCTCGATGDIFKAYECENGSKPFPEMLQSLSEMLHLQVEEKTTVIKTTRHDYFDEVGTLAYYKLRIDLSNGKKTFAFYKADGTKGLMSGQRHFLYNLPEIIKHRGTRNIFIVEGEKCADALNGIGLIATSTDTGAGKWDADNNHYFQDSSIIILTDNDEPGKKHGELVAGSLKPFIKSLKVILLPELKAKGDVFDWLQDGHTKAELIEIVKASPEWEPVQEIQPECNIFDSISAEDLQKKDLPETQFIIKNLLSVGLHIIAGSPKVGKSWLMIFLCLQIAKGEDIWNFKTEMGTTVYLALEDSQNRIKGRMLKVIGNEKAPANIHFVFKAPPIDDGLQEGIKQVIKNYPDVKLLIIDTFAKVRKVSRNEGYQNDYKDTAALKTLADESNIGILLVHHLRKAKADDPFEAVSGTTGIVGAADTIFVMQKKDRQSTEATLHVTGRDIEQMEILLNFNKSNCVWDLISCDAENYREEVAFKNDAVIYFLKSFINDDRQQWEGSTSDLFVEMMKVIEETENVVDIPRTPAALGKRLQEQSGKFKKINILMRTRRVNGKTKISLQYSIDIGGGGGSGSSSRWGEVAVDVKSENADISTACSSSGRSSGNIQESVPISFIDDYMQESESSPHYPHLPPLAIEGKELHENEAAATSCYLPPPDVGEELLSGAEAIDFLKKGGEFEV